MNKAAFESFTNPAHRIDASQIHNPNAIDLNFCAVDYLAIDPKGSEKQSQRGNTEGVKLYDIESDAVDVNADKLSGSRQELELFVKEATGLLQGTLSAPAVVIRQIDGGSKKGEAFRDEVMHLLGYALGFDVDGALTEIEEEYEDQEKKAILDQGDREFFGIELEDPDKPIDCSAIRRLDFGSRFTNDNWALMEVEFPSINSQGVLRTARIIALCSQ